MTSWWHILKSTARFGGEVVQRVWDKERAEGVVTAGYGNQADGPGRDKLAKYQPGDELFVYAPQFGLVGLAEVTSASPEHAPQLSRDEHAHRRRVRWITAVDNITDAVPVDVVRASAYIPLTLATRLPVESAARLRTALERAVAQQAS